MDKFADIRPYHDHEVAPIIQKIIADEEFVNAISDFKLNYLPEFIRPIFHPLLRYVLRRQTKGVDSVAEFQERVRVYFEHMVATTTDGFTVSGLEKLDLQKSYLYVGNHRDITLDPAFVNYARLLHGCRKTVRIAVGDNLLSKEFISDLIRVNKSFVVKRSERAPRKLLENLKVLSEYIAHSLFEDNECVWIAQREGRAKDGVDRSDPAIIKMFAINGRKQGFANYIRSLNIIPVSISYEYDPCALLKARELYALAETGKYVKSKYEDITSIATGISGYKGHVHLSFGDPLPEGLESPDDVAQWLDRQIIDLYVLHPTNYFAYYRVYGKYPEGGVYSDKHLPFMPEKLSGEKKKFDAHIDSMPEECRSYALNAYANPIVSKIEFGFWKP